MSDTWKMVAIGVLGFLWGAVSVAANLDETEEVDENEGKEELMTLREAWEKQYPGETFVDLGSYSYGNRSAKDEGDSTDDIQYYVNYDIVFSWLTYMADKYENEGLGIAARRISKTSLSDHRICSKATDWEVVVTYEYAMSIYYDMLDIFTRGIRDYNERYFDSKSFKTSIENYRKCY